MKRFFYLLACSLVAISMTACGSSGNTEQVDTSAAVNSDFNGTTGEYSATEPFSGNLDKDVSWQGVTLKVDSTWREVDSYQLRYVLDDSCLFHISPYLNGETESLETLRNVVAFSNEDYDFKVQDEWDDNGVHYYVMACRYMGMDEDHSFAQSRYVLVGYSPDGKGFTADFQMGTFWNENEATAKSCLETISYDPTQTTMDYPTEQKAAAATSSNGSSNSSVSTDSKIVSTLKQFGTFDEQTIEGNGDNVVDLPNVGYPHLLVINYSGSSNFAVEALDASGNQLDLLINTIGSYSGTVTDFTDYEQTAMLQVSSSGPWSITVKPLSAMEQANSGQTFNGDNVVYIDTTSLSKLTINNSGDSNFVVQGIGFSSAKLLVNEIGAYSGTVVWAEPQSFLIVNSSGDWSLSW